MPDQYFRAVGLSHQHAPLALRERLALDEAVCRRLLATLHQRLGLADVLVLSTCSRTEIYYCHAHDRSAAVLSALVHEKGEPDAAEFAPHVARYTAPGAAVQHLFEVALGLDAPVLGDQQIGGQVKRAYQWAAEAGTAGPYLHRLLHTIFFVGKRVQAETAFREGAASAASATLGLVQHLTRHQAAPRVLVVGVGEIGTDVARHFAASARYGPVVLCNRTPAPAVALAAELGLAVLPWAHLARGIEDADVVVVAAAGGPCLTLALMQQVTVLSNKFLVDLAVPRSIEAAVEDVPGVLVFTLDDVQDRATEALASRRAAVPQVQALIAEAVADLQEWSETMAVSPVIQQLKSALERLRQEEMQRFGKNSTPAETRLLDEMTRSLMQKVLKQPVLQLKAACRRGEPGPLVTLLAEVFDLERPAVAAGRN